MRQTTEGSATQTSEQTSTAQTDGDAKPSLLNEGDKKPKTDAEGKAKPETKPETKPTAPEKYETFKAPEGFTYDEKTLGEASAKFKELGLTQDQAQSLLDIYAKQAAEAAAAPYKHWEDMNAKWVEAVKADPEIGPKLPQVKESISRALDTLGDPKLVADFKAAMDLTGAGNNPAFVKAFYKLSQAVNEGRPVTGKNPSPHSQTAPGAPTRPSAAQALYPRSAG